jgi:hypothetical protein
MPDDVRVLSSTHAHDLVAAWDRHVQQRATRRLSGQAARLLRRFYATLIEGRTAATWPAERAAGARRALVRYGVQIGGSEAQLESLADGVTWAADREVTGAGKALIAYLARREALCTDVVPALAPDDSIEPPF